MRLAYSRYEEIKKIITDILVDYGINTLPIDVFLLAKRMSIIALKYSEFIADERIKIISSSNDGMSLYSYSLKSYFILYNDNMDINRIRFTIAHEIGHIALGHEESNDETESEADYFARHLLVPMSIIIFNEITDYMSITIMFEVSKTVAGNVISHVAKRIDSGHEKLEDYEIELLKHFRQFIK